LCTRQTNSRVECFYPPWSSMVMWENGREVLHIGQAELLQKLMASYRRRCSSGFRRQNTERLKLFCLVKRRILRPIWDHVDK
ncbi:unnamed protein product, partial [Brassica oleracea]